MNLAERAMYDEDAARAYLEKLRWPDGPFCPHCGVLGKVYRLPVRKGKRQVLKCASCRKQFSVTVGTIFEDSHIPLHKWMLAFHLYSTSKKGMSAHQLHRSLKVTYKSAWFMAHRIRYCMGQSPMKEKLSGVIEADTTFIGGKEKNKHWGERRHTKEGGSKGKIPVFSLVERGGQVRSIVMDKVTAPNLRKAIMESADLRSRLMTDSQSANTHMGDFLSRHDMVDHKAEEYARIGRDGVMISTNTIESVFSLLKRGVFGTFHHVSRKHLHRYLDEFDFRWNTRSRLGVNDDERTDIALRRAEGKRLTYREPIAALRETGQMTLL
jgi:transposase-like protein